MKSIRNDNHSLFFNAYGLAIFWHLLNLNQGLLIKEISTSYEIVYLLMPDPTQVPKCFTLVLRCGNVLLEYLIIEYLMPKVKRWEKAQGNIHAFWVLKAVGLEREEGERKLLLYYSCMCMVYARRWWCNILSLPFSVYLVFERECVYFLIM